MPGVLLRRFFKESLIYTIGGAARQLVGIILVPIYTRVFAPAEFGVIDLLTTVISILIIVLMLGIDSGLGRYYADTDDHGERREIASTSLLYLLGGGVLLLPIAIGFRQPLSTFILGEPHYSGIFALAACSVAPTLLLMHFKNVLKWQRRAKTVLLFSIAAILTQTALTILLVVGFRMGLAGIYIAAIAVPFTFLPIGWYLTRQTHIVTFSTRWLSRMIRYGTPIAFLGAAVYVLTYADRYFLQYYHGLAAVGLYGLAYKVASAVSLLFMGFRVALGPFVYSTFREEGAPQKYAQIFDYVSVICAILLLTVSLFAREIVLIFGGRTYEAAYPVVPLLAGSLAVYTLGSYFAFGIGIAEKTIHQVWTSGSAAGLNIALNFLLIPRFGVWGAAIATFGSYILLAGLQQIISQRYYRVPYRYVPHFAMYSVLAILVFGGMWYGVDKTLTERLVAKAAILVIGSTVPVLFHLVGKSDFLRLLGLLLPRYSPAGVVSDSSVDTGPHG